MNLILLIIFIFVLFYIFFQKTLNVFENKINEIKFQQSNIQVELPEHFKNPPTYIIESKKYPVDPESEESLKIDPKIDQDFSKKNNFLLEGFNKNESKDDYKKWEQTKSSSHLCREDHKHSKCNLGVMNYADPKDLSQMDFNIFKLNYPPNMTMQDYIHWLYCYKGEEYKLPYNHLKNLEKLKKGIELKEEKGVCPPPGYDYAPLTSDKYFDQMYNINDEFNIAGKLNSPTGPLLGYNAEDYSEFNQNLDVKGTSSYLRNCDIALKKTAKHVRDFVQPKDSNDIDQSKLYEKYYVKENEI